MYASSLSLSLSLLKHSSEAPVWLQTYYIAEVELEPLPLLTLQLLSAGTLGMYHHVCFKQSWA